MKRTLCAMMVVLTGTATSQLIPLKTVPLATGEQFLFHPAENRSMGGVSLALDDSLSDPYHNPAAGILVSGIRIFSSPLYYGIGLNEGRSGGSNGKTFPLGMSFRTGDFFGGMIWARQTLATDQSSGFAGLRQILPDMISHSGEEYSNTYTFGMFGFKIPGTSFSVGVSALWSDLNAIEGVQYLYPNARDLWQRGSITEYRAGLRSEWEGERVFEFLFAHQSTDMKHGYTQPPVFLPWEGDLMMMPGAEHIEQDQSSGYALETSYRQSVAEHLHAGAVLAVDVKTYPKIPNYELMNIPRDPGNSIAWNFGFGLASKGEKSIIGFDMIYEPATSETWAEAAVPIQTSGGRTIAIGGRTVENAFDFYNHIIRFGIRSAVHDLGVGLSLHRIKYYLKQIDHVQEEMRRQREEWTEVTLSLGFGFDLFGGHVKYLGLFSTGTGRPGVVDSIARGTMDAANFMIAPSGSLVLDEAWTGTHQISFILQLP
ncbi:MAG: hypothetical protein WEB37_05935 [Bacteroidota bacterium]